MTTFRFFAFLTTFAIVIFSCNDAPEARQHQTKNEVAPPKINTDSLVTAVKKQVQAVNFLVDKDVFKWENNNAIGTLKRLYKNGSLRFLVTSEYGQGRSNTEKFYVDENQKLYYISSEHLSCQTIFNENNQPLEQCTKTITDYYLANENTALICMQRKLTAPMHQNLDSLIQRVPRMAINCNDSDFQLLIKKFQQIIGLDAAQKVQNYYNKP